MSNVNTNETAFQKVPCGGFQIGDGLSCAGGVLSVGDLGDKEIKTFETVTDYLTYCVDEYYDIKHYCLGYVKTLEGFSDSLKHLLTPPILCYGLYSYYQYGNISYVYFVDQCSVKGFVNHRYKQIIRILCETRVAAESTNVGTRFYSDNFNTNEIYSLKELVMPYSITGENENIWTFFKSQYDSGKSKYTYFCPSTTGDILFMEITTTSTPDGEGYYYTVTFTPSEPT